MIQFFIQNKDWLVPLLTLVGNEAVKVIPTKKDYDVFKFLSWLFEFILNSNKGKKKRFKPYAKGTEPGLVTWSEKKLNRNELIAYLKSKEDEGNKRNT